MKPTNTITTIIAFSILFFGNALAAPSPVNGQCGSIDGNTITNFPVGANDTTALCDNGEINNFNNFGSSSSRNLSWTCDGLYGGSSVPCSAQGNANLWNDMNTNGTGCGIANNESFITNAPDLLNIGVAYTNTNNVFLGNLCQSDTAPTTFSESSLGWDWECPGVWSGTTFIDNSSCHADFYYDSQCGNAAGTGQQSQPTTNLCSPGSVATMVRYNTETNLWEWECDGGGVGAVSFCNAWATSTGGISPQCNPFTINQPNTSITGSYVDGFPGTDLCGIGFLSEWTVDSFFETATWKCKFGNQETPVCGNVFIDGYTSNAGQSCNGLANGQTFDNLSTLTSLGLCSNDGIPDSFDDMTNKWQWSCGIQNCEAFKNTELTMCGYATNVPSLTPPTQGLCQQGQVVTQVYKFENNWKWVCSDIQNGGYCNNLGCQVNFPNQAAVCESPRIVIGACEWQTLIDIDGFHTTNDLIQAGLCDDGYPDPLIPEQNFTLGKRSWTCKGTPVLGNDSQECLANPGMPELDIVYDINRPQTFPTALSSGELIDGPVIASLIGYDPLYLSFVTPYNQNHRLFTQNAYFLFEYQDWAGNTGDTMVFVDWIREAGTQAFAIYSTTEQTSGYVDVILSGYDSAQNPTTFAGPCIGAGHCSIIVGAHPYDLTIRFTQSNEGTFTITDSNGVIQQILVNVDNIDTTIPTATLDYSHRTTTSDDVIVELISPSEPITVTNNGGSLTYTFTNTGEFTFEIMDEAGNTNSLKAEVTWIDKDAPTAEVVYSTTGVTDQNVYAVLSGMETGVYVHNNNGSNSYTFTYNGDFAFIIVDEAGLTGTVVATVSWINKPILDKLINKYKKNICHLVKHRMPIDIQTNEHNFEIITAIRNCRMQSFKGYNNHTQFYPRRDITRAEFLRVVGRFVRMTSKYEDELINYISDDFINVIAKGGYSKDISEADARGLLFYTPLLQEGINKTIDFNAPMTQREAKYIIREMLTLINMDPNIVNHLINEDGNISRGETAYVFSNLGLSFEEVAIGNNLELLKALQYRLSTISDYQDQRKFMTKILLKLSKIPDNLLKRVGLHPLFLKQDLMAIIQSKMPERREKAYITIKTIMDNYIREFPDPHNNEVFNDYDNYEYLMFEDY